MAPLIARMAFGLCMMAAVAPAQVPAGPQFQIGAYPSDQWLPRVSMEPDGDFVVVWTSRLQDGSGTGVFGQRFGASGVPASVAFQVNTYTTGDQGDPDVSVGSRGDFVVAWARIVGDYGESIHARRYDVSGSAIGDEFQVSTSPAVTIAWGDGPHVGRASDGRFIVGWAGSDDYGAGMLARRYAASGDPIGGEFVLNPTTTNAEYWGDVAVEGNGNFVAVWTSYANGILGQRYDSEGVRLGGEFRVNSNPGTDHYRPRVGVSRGGAFVVVWCGRGSGNQLDAFGRRFDAMGNALGNDFLVSAPAPGRNSRPDQVSYDDQGNFVVTWEERTAVDAKSYGRRYSATGGPRGSEFLISAAPDFQGFASVASDPVGNFAVTWVGFPLGGPVKNYGQRYGGLQPAALAVDTGRNGVLEAGETVDMRPAWRNINGATQTFSSTLSNLTGPSGPVYNLVDGTGDYGAVGDGVVGPCVDCFSVSVSAPAVRPAVHWDASAVESILPDAQGQQQRWLLHVGESFTDVPLTSGFYRFVETVLHRGVTGGCSAAAYCPSASTTREQMAVFVLLAKEKVGYAPPPCTTPVFADVPAISPFCRWIEELARRAVVSGCGGGLYCPDAPVSREQLAVFVLRALDGVLAPPACATPLFADVPAASPFCKWIEELARRNVVTGCGGGNYCPGADVTREQMSVFLAVTFGLTLYGS